MERSVNKIHKKQIIVPNGSSCDEIRIFGCMESNQKMVNAYQKLGHCSKSVLNHI